jgi:hypothetical protein
MAVIHYSETKGSKRVSETLQESCVMNPNRIVRLTVGMMLLLGTIFLYAQSSRSLGLDPWVRKTEFWHNAVIQHKRGILDSAEKEISSWLYDDYNLIISSFLTIIGHMPETHYALPKEVEGHYQEYLQTVSGFFKPSNQMDKFLLKAALFHTDMAILEMETIRGYVPHWPKSVLQNSPELIFSNPWRVVKINDGLSSAGEEGLQWSRASMLVLCGTFPLQTSHTNTLSRETARRWLVATTAIMLKNRKRAFADNNIERGLHFFPSDPDLLFLSGALHEIFAMPQNQNVLPLSGYSFKYGSTEAELKSAQNDFQKSLKKNYNFPEAHLRLGRVTGLRGDHATAIHELQTALDNLTDPRSQYYACLFLGNEYLALHQREEAKRHFERASNLFPEAQSPLLSLSYLARSSGHPKDALIITQKLLDLSASPLSSDPWWDYDIPQSIDSDALISSLWAQTESQEK